MQDFKTIAIFTYPSEYAVLRLLLEHHEIRHVFHPRVDYHKFRNLSIETPAPAAINVDGENIGSTPLNIEVLPSAIQICVPHSE